jgi:hypothetical protein
LQRRRFKWEPMVPIAMDDHEFVQHMKLRAIA